MRRLIRDSERKALTGIATSTWYALQAKGEAPRPVRIGPRSVAWVESEVMEWIEQRIAAKDARAPIIVSPNVGRRPKVRATEGSAA